MSTIYSNITIIETISYDFEDYKKYLEITNQHEKFNPTINKEDLKSELKDIDTIVFDAYVVADYDMNLISESLENVVLNSDLNYKNQQLDKIEINKLNEK